MDTPDPTTPRRKPAVRLWLVSLLLFASGFVGKLVMEGGRPPDQGYPLVMAWQMGWYGAGMLVWWAWCNTEAGKGKAGCWIGLALAAAASLAVMSSSPK